jgi:hypothetical protein
VYFGSCSLRRVVEEISQPEEVFEEVLFVPERAVGGNDHLLAGPGLPSLLLVKQDSGRKSNIGKEV